MSIRVLPLPASALCALLVTGCIAIPADRGASDSVALLRSRSMQADAVVLGPAASSDVTALLDQPLDADAAVRLALVNSPRMQGLYAELGLAQADVYDASRLSNPSLGFMQLAGGGAQRRTWTLTQRFTDLLFIGYRTQLGRSALLQAQQRVAQAVLEMEAVVRTAYYQMLVTELLQQLHQQISDAAAASSSYAQSLFKAGNISELQLSREQAAASRARIGWQQAQSVALERRRELMTLLGLSLLDTRVQFVQTLEVPVSQRLDIQALQQWAAQQRMDVALLHEQLGQLSNVQIHTRRWFWLDDAALELERETETDGSVLNGVGGSVGLPLFNQGGGARLRATAQVESIAAELSEVTLAMSNDVAAQVQALEQARLAVEEYRNQLVPLQERITALTQQQQNYMLVGTFELLSARQEALQTYRDYLQATADYWIRHVALERTVGGKLPDTAGDASYGISVGVDALPDAGAADTATSNAEQMSEMPGMSSSPAADQFSHHH